MKEEKPFNLRLIFAIAGRNDELQDFAKVSSFQVGDMGGRTVWTVTETSGKQSVFLETELYKLIRYIKEAN